MSRLAAHTRTLLLALLLVVPLVAGAIFAAMVNLQSSAAWSSPADDAAAGAPVATSPSGIDPTRLIDARRAAGEAGAQAGFLTSGTAELTDGVSEMQTGAEALPEQFGEAVTGAQELSQGMVELQAGVGQLGTGANEIADGVGGAVDQVIALEALKGQLNGAIDHTVGSLENVDDPDVIEARETLTDLRRQVDLVKLPADVTRQLESLKEGSRELSNQLSVPGYAFHDGIYSATRGAQDLSYGLGQAQGEVDEAISGVTALDEGAQQIDRMATQTQDRIDAIQRALPVTQVADVDAAAAESLSPSLPPMYAMLIAALVMLGGVATGLAMRFAPGRGWWILTGSVLGLTALGVLLLAIVASGLTLATGALGALVLAFGIVASAALTRVLFELLHPIVGAIVASILGLAQVGIVGWVWNSSSSTDMATIWQILANLSPLNWATSGLTTIGNSGSTQMMWLALAVLGAIAFLGLISVARAPKSASSRVED